jgi:hypothetical protein
LIDYAKKSKHQHDIGPSFLLTSNKNMPKLTPKQQRLVANLHVSLYLVNRIFDATQLSGFQVAGGTDLESVPPIVIPEQVVIKPTTEASPYENSIHPIHVMRFLFIYGFIRFRRRREAGCRAPF